MKQIKKLLCILLTLILSIGLFAGCADKETDPGASTDPSASPSASPSDAAGSFDYSAPLTEDGFFKDIKASELVSLDYKGLSIPSSVLTADPADVQTQIDALLQEQAQPGDPIMDRAVADGDTLNIDYVGSVDGVEFEGGSTGGQGSEVTIGVTNFIDDFLEQLIGHMPGENFDIEVTFPDPYSNNPDLAGKDAVFNITINHIVGEPVLPELSDEIAQQYDFDTVDELVADIEDWLISTQKDTYFKENIALKATVSQIPQTLLDYVRDSDLAYFEYYAQAYGTDVETLIASITGYSSLDAYLSAQESFYQDTATFYLVCQAIAETEGLSVTEADVENSDYAGAAETYGMPYLKMYVLHNTICRDFVFDNATVA